MGSRSIQNNRITVKEIAAEGLCTGCGTCSGICPSGSIDMTIDTHRGIYSPTIDVTKCKLCGLCYDACPGHGVNFDDLNIAVFGVEPNDNLLGNCLACYLGYSNNIQIRHDAASGGLVTALLLYALEHGIIDGALVTKMSNEEPLQPQPFIARTPDDLIAAIGSKYCPVPANAALREILAENDSKRYAVVGLPCHIQGIRKAERRVPKLRERIAFCLGIVCSHTDKFDLTEYILHKHGITSSEIGSIGYRGQGWPGSARICMKSGEIKTIPYNDYISLHELHFFSPSRCTSCCDFIAQLADITLMDAWLPEIMMCDHEGSSIAICRTDIGRNLCDNAYRNCDITVNPIQRDDVLRSQGQARLSNADIRANFLFHRIRRKAIPAYGQDFIPSKPLNYLRTIVMRFNAWFASRRHFRRYLKPLLKIERFIFIRLKSRI